MFIFKIGEVTFSLAKWVILRKSINDLVASRPSESTVLTWRENDHVQQFNKNYFGI